MLSLYFFALRDFLHFPRGEGAGRWGWVRELLFSYMILRQSGKSYFSLHNSEDGWEELLFPYMILGQVEGNYCFLT